MNRSFYHSLNEYYQKVFGRKAYKLSLNAGLSCPNRDGSIGFGGCIFCSEGGSGEFASQHSASISHQITEAIETVSSKYSGDCFVAYFQAFTNTYGSIDYLRSVFTQAVTDPRVSGISIATRPDCLEPEKIALLVELARIKPLWIELGLQTSNEATAVYIRRGYENRIFQDAVERLHLAGIQVIAHMIIGLPGESHSDYMATARYIASLKIGGIKLQLLHVLQGTELAKEYQKGTFETLSQGEYVTTIVDLIESLPPEMVVHRITGDGPKSLLLAPLWSGNKKSVLNSINKEFISRNTFQGKEYKKWL